MYKLMVPISKGGFVKREKTVEYLKKAKVDCAIIVSERKIHNKNEYNKEILLIKDNVEHFREAGFEVGVWIGETIGHWNLENCEKFDKDMETCRKWVDIFDNESNRCFCPADEIFLLHIKKWIKDVACFKPDLIMLDDDFRTTMHGNDNTGCLCDWHLAEFNRRAGEKLTRSEIRKLVFTEKPNRYRKIWLELQRDTLINAAKDFREALNEVNNTIRMGLCASPSTWDIDGVDSITLTKVLAGDTKPFLRLNGAPYWVNGTQHWGGNASFCGNRT